MRWKCLFSLLFLLILNPSAVSLNLKEQMLTSFSILFFLHLISFSLLLPAVLSSGTRAVPVIRPRSLISHCWVCWLPLQPLRFTSEQSPNVCIMTLFPSYLFLSGFCFWSSLLCFQSVSPPFSLISYSLPSSLIACPRTHKLTPVCVLFFLCLSESVWGGVALVASFACDNQEIWQCTRDWRAIVMIKNNLLMTPLIAHCDPLWVFFQISVIPFLILDIIWVLCAFASP